MNPAAQSPINQLRRLSHLDVLKKSLLGLPAKIQQTIKQPFFTRHPHLKKLLQLIVLPVANPLARYSILAVFFVGLALLAYMLRDLPSPTRLTSQENFSVSTQIFDRNGTLLYEIFADENRTPIEIKTLPPHFVQATLAIEDKNFFKHFGFDFEGIIRAVKNNFTGEQLQGGSTITQQLVKNALLTNEKSFQRKIKEAVLSVMTEIIYSKEDILEMYLNYISYGGTAVGVESAAKQYFDKSAKDLSLAEAAMIAGLPQAPSLYSPFGSDPQRAKNRQVEVLRRMVEEGYITPLQAEEAKAAPLQFALKNTDIRAPHFVFYVRDMLYEQYGEETVTKGGLRVTTSLDINLQEAAEATLSAEVDTLTNLRVGNGAALITKPNTGEILAMVGSRNYFDSEHDGQVNVTIARRQPGSSIKPLVYATAFQEKTLNPGTLLLDIPTCIKLPNQPDYCPKNYTGDFKGPVTVRQALGNSLNIPAVKTVETISVQTFMNQATKMGITGWNDAVNYGPSIALGGGEVRMIDMAQAFGVLANQGVKVPLLPILKVENYKGEVLAEADLDQRAEDLKTLQDNPDEYWQGDAERVLAAAPAYLVSHIMQDNNARTLAFGSNSQLVIPDQVVSVKTGTTNDLKDNWTIGFTPEFLVATWVGNNDNTQMSYIASGVTGAAPIWHDLMSYILAGREPLWQTKPADVIEGTVCPTGLPKALSERDCAETNEEYYWTEGKPSRSSLVSKEIWIKPETGLPPAFGEQVEGLVLETHMLYQDPVTSIYCGDCHRAVDEQGKIVYEKHYTNEEGGEILFDGQPATQPTAEPTDQLTP
jgi:1A family penicillin-binding protein